MKKRLLAVMLCILLVSAVAVGVWACYWIARKDCLCYKARFYPGKSQPIDNLLLEYASPQSGVMSIQTAECEHGEKLWLNVSEDGYFVQRFSK